MTLQELADRLCSELPSGWKLVMECEKGEFGLHLVTPLDSIVFAGPYDTFDTQALCLLDVAKKRANPTGKEGRR